VPGHGWPPGGTRSHPQPAEQRLTVGLPLTVLPDLVPTVCSSPSAGG
jgi:hypothetical protein